MRRFLPFTLVLAAACASKQATPVAEPKPQAAAAEPAPVSPLDDSAASSDVERIFTLPGGKGPAFGPEAAKVTLEVCSDFQCPFCARLVPTLHELEENYGELVRVRWRNCPLPMHPDALPAAEAALEVYTQGGDKAFWAYHDQLFAHQDALDAASLVKLSSGIAGVDGEKVRAALTDHRHVAAVQADLRAVLDSGAAAGGFGTPATFVNGRLISGAQPYEVFEQAVERGLAETPEARAQAEAASRAAYPMITLRHVLVQFQGARGAEASVTRTKDEARARANELSQRLLGKHITFDDAVKTHSDDQSPNEGGLLGRFTRGELMPEIDRVVFALQPGEVSPVVETPFGFHLFLRSE